MRSMRVGDSFVVPDRVPNAVRTLVGYWNRKRHGKWVARKVARVGMRVERIA